MLRIPLNDANPHHPTLNRDETVILPPPPLIEDILCLFVCLVSYNCKVC